MTGPFKIRTSAMTCGYQRTSSPVTALPMIMRWISDVPSKIVKVVEDVQFPQLDGLMMNLLSARTQHDCRLAIDIPVAGALN
jgi:hypothetical protein